MEFQTFAALGDTNFSGIADDNIAQYDSGSSKWVNVTPAVLAATLDHGNLDAGSLGDDDHVQYLLLAGRSGGQVVFGGTGAADDFTFRANSNGTPSSGKFFWGITTNNSVYDAFNAQWGFGTLTTHEVATFGGRQSLLEITDPTSAVAGHAAFYASGVAAGKPFWRFSSGNGSAITEMMTLLSSNLLFVRQDGTKPLTDDWDNIGRRIRNTGVAEVQDAPPSTPATGLIWLDTDATGSGSGSSLNLDVITTTTTLTTSNTIVICDATSGAITVDLPTAVGNAGKVYYIKKIDSSANSVTIDGDGSETIDTGLTAVILTQFSAITIVSDGTEWWILS